MSDLTQNIEDYDFDLPEELIAQAPAAQRREARMMIARRNPTAGEPRFEDVLVSDLPQVIDANPSLKHLPWIRNRSRVFKARCYARRPSGGRHELVFLEPVDRDPEQKSARVIARKSKEFRYPQKLILEGGQMADPIEVLALSPNTVQLDRPWYRFLEVLESRGEMPLPPYIKSRDGIRDTNRYQTVWADKNKTGSAAAPTASLHFDEALVVELEQRGVRFHDLYLHVGLGTFEPLRSNHIAENALHHERVEIPLSTAEILNHHKKALAIGTTAFRSIESLARMNLRYSEIQFTNEHGAICGSTAYFFRPPEQALWVQALLTNFHLPKSSLFVLMATFAGSRALALDAYKWAINKRFRFFSYGDASLWI